MGRDSFLLIVGMMIREKNQKIKITLEKVAAVKAQRISIGLDKIYQSTKIVFPPQKHRSPHPWVELRGVAHPGDKISVLVSNRKVSDFLVQSDSTFLFEKTPLPQEKNIVEVVNITQQQKGIQLFSCKIMVFYDQRLAPYYTLLDPVTRTRLTSFSLERIVRCRSSNCLTFHLVDSWDAFGACSVCGGRRRFHSNDGEFWVC